MKQNKFMSRVFSAMDNQESEVIDQITSDLDAAKAEGTLDSEEYSITYSEGTFRLFDKINNEETQITETPDESELIMEDVTESDKSFARKFGNIVVFRVGDYDVEYNFSTQIATVIGVKDRIEIPMSSRLSLPQFMNEISDQIRSLPKNFSDFNVTEKDLQEFNYWEKGKKVTPRLRDKFDSDKDYEDYMMGYQEKQGDTKSESNFKNFSNKSLDKLRKLNLIK